MTRTENSTKNMYTGLINQFLILIFRFITRTVFIKCLGNEFLGINGLFSNILTLLSLADLGIGGALVYLLYEPIAKGDKKKQILIVKYLKKVYKNIGIAIILIGIFLTPFLKYIIKDDVSIVNINIVFLIYVFECASSYLFFAAKTEFLCANQKRYIYNNISNIVTILSNIVQIIVLIIFKNFYIYLIVIIIFNILRAFLVSLETNKMFPFITKKINEELSLEERKEVFKDSSSLMIYRVNYVVLTATDNVIISKYLGLFLVGLYSNYVLITNSIVNILSSFFDSISAGIGNLHVGNLRDKEYFIFNLINFITVCMFGIFSIGVYVLANDFITIWLDNEYLLEESFVLIISINLYVEGLRKFLSTYRSTYGLFRNAKFIPLFGVIVNIIVSIILVKRIGIIGVLLGTLISNLLSFMWYDPYIIHRKVFKKNVWKYYLKNIWYFLFFIILGLICDFICDFIVIDTIMKFIICGLICAFLPILVIFIVYFKSDYFKYLQVPFKEFLNKIIAKFKK